MGHRQYAVLQVLGQSHAIGMVSFAKGCGKSKPPGASPLSTPVPIPCYWHGLFGEGLGQLKAIGSLPLDQLWANSTLLAMPVSREAGSIPCYRHCIFRGRC